ncbi:hypothetical protein ULF88_19385 [Halopseudomonas pachastrellae]|nr:hypothetical protein [Halopseudomonas pachastrellae]
MRLLGLAFSQSQGHLRKYLSEVYEGVSALHGSGGGSGPGHSPAGAVWRVHFMLGSAAFTMSSMKALRAIAEAELGEPRPVDSVLRLMVPFLAAGMRADSAVAQQQAALA